MKKIFLAIILFSCFALGYYYFTGCQSDFGTIHGGTNEENSQSLQQSRQEWEFERLKDPATNSIPRDMKRKEIEFARRLPKSTNRTKAMIWTARGPYNVGGRTRGMAVDVTNDNNMLAGGVSGGLWRSTNGGQSWAKVTRQDQLHNITCIAQDTRPGKTNIWYYGTGERLGNSASESFSATFLGDGIFKSTDNGITWEPILATNSGTPHWYDKFDNVWQVAIDPHNDTADVLYAAIFRGLMKSTNGGNTWEQIFYANTGSYCTSVAVGKNGVVYAAMGSWDANGENYAANKGIWRSPDGVTWTKITPVDFASVYERIVIGIDPSDEDKIYFLANTPGSGQHSYVFFGGEEWNSLWKYNYVSGNGSDSTNIWTNLSANIPAGNPSAFDNFYCQGSYDLTIAVKPDNPNVVFIGGTNLYRSTDGFTTPTNTKQLGGYRPGSIDSDWGIYPSHHPDQHVITFLQSDPDVLISANDGGVFKTTDCMADSVVWTRLNNGYQTTQVYTIIIDQKNTDDDIIAGFQDNGNFFTNSTDPEAIWVMPLNGDGSYGHIADLGDTYYLSIQNGKVYKMNIDANGNALGYERVDPIGATNYQFINPFVVDPNNSNLMYLPAGNQVWRNDSLNYISINNTKDSISQGWFKYSDVGSGYISSIVVSEVPANIVYYAAGTKIYRIDSANVGDPNHVLKYTTQGRVSCLAVDPRDGNKVMAVVSNYRTYSLFYSKNGGTNWSKVAGNLEEYASGSGNGPSCRWVSIMPQGNKTLYLLGTSVGLFATDTLHEASDSTEWTNIATETIGNVIVEMICTRQTDNLVVVGCHGAGIFSTHINSMNDIVLTSVQLPEKAFLCPGDTLYLDGTALHYDSIAWTTNGDGTFSAVHQPEGIYIPGVNDTTSHTVTLTLSAYRNSVVVTGQMAVEITSPPTKLFNSNIIYSNRLDTIVLDAGEGYSAYFWSNNANSSGRYSFPSEYGTYFVTVTRGGCEGVDSVQLHFDTGIETITNNLAYMNLFPNPARNTISCSLELEGKACLTTSIYSASGRLVLEERTNALGGKQDLTMSISSLPKGNYYFVVSDGINRKTKKFIKM